MSVHSIQVRSGSIAEVVAITQQIPEFINPHQAGEYEKRLNAVPFLILVAEYGGKIAGFKVGYALDKTLLYSWMGAVLPEFRQFGVAKTLAAEQEKWAREQGFTRIQFKTRNHFKAMLHFGLGNGFNIIAVEPQGSLSEYRILLEKAL